MKCGRLGRGALLGGESELLFKAISHCNPNIISNELNSVAGSVCVYMQIDGRIGGGVVVERMLFSTGSRC